MTISQFYGTRVVVVVLAPKYVFAIYGLLLFRGRRIETTETFSESLIITTRLWEPENGGGLSTLIFFVCKYCTDFYSKKLGRFLA
jgi:hypothetical protein